MSIQDTAVVSVLCTECKKDVVFEAKDATQRNVRTIKCDAPGCTHEVTYDRKDERTVFENPDNSWLKSTRVTQTADGRNLVTCSDACNVELVKTGQCNIPEAPKVASVSSQADVLAAVAMAKARAEADAAIRSGQPAKVQLTDN